MVYNIWVISIKINLNKILKISSCSQYGFHRICCFFFPNSYILTLFFNFHYSTIRSISEYFLWIFAWPWFKEMNFVHFGHMSWWSVYFSYLLPKSTFSRQIRVTSFTREACPKEEAEVTGNALVNHQLVLPSWSEYNKLVKAYDQFW